MGAYPIPEDLAEGFRTAVERYYDWSPGVPELLIMIAGQAYPMNAACDFVEKFGDELPEPILDRLLYYVDITSNDLKQKLAVDRTYRTGAYCLRELIKRRKDAYQRREEARRNR